jgi:signal transduction histidine kinase
MGGGDAVDLTRDDRPVSILIVDDHFASRIALEATLAPLGAQLISVLSGKDALKALETEDCACALLDVQLPELDGWETTRRIKSQERTRHLPILLLTDSCLEADHIRRGYEAGAVDYILEPYDPDILRAKVKVFIDLYRRAPPRSALREDRDPLDPARLSAEAQQAVRGREAFLLTALQELRRPAFLLSQMLSTWEREAEDQENFSFAHHMKTGRHKLKSLEAPLELFLDVLRISAGQLTLERDEVDLAAAAREVSARLDSSACRFQCPLQLECDTPVTGRWDRFRVKQVISCLLANAIEYGHGQPVHLRVEAAGDHARIIVRDEGSGIAPDEQARIFEKFERAASKHYAGWEIGLFTARRIVEALGGRIDVRSALGEGTTFTVELPRAHAAPRELPPPRGP